jgi:hypothetical protein
VVVLAHLDVRLDVFCVVRLSISQEDRGDVGRQRCLPANAENRAGRGRRTAGGQGVAAVELSMSQDTTASRGVVVRQALNGG